MQQSQNNIKLFLKMVLIINIIRNFTNRQKIKMDKIKKDYFTDQQTDLARYAKALGHPVRIAILQLLNSQSCCYHGDMAEELPIAKSTLSQHLNELKDAGLIQGTITPPTVKYCINRENWTIAKTLMNDLLK
jgi:ArsR family transcriptional regulator